MPAGDPDHRCGLNSRTLGGLSAYALLLTGDQLFGGWCGVRAASMRSVSAYSASDDLCPNLAKRYRP